MPVPLDCLEEKPVWKDGFDFRLRYNKGAAKSLGNRPFAVLLTPVILGISVAGSFSEVIKEYTVHAILATMLLYAAWLFVLVRRVWRLRGDHRQLTVSKSLSKLSWGQRDFAWDTIRNFDTKVQAHGFFDIVVQTNNGEHAMGFELSFEDSNELVANLTKMADRAKMESLARAGYRGVRAPSSVDVEGERVEAEIVEALPKESIK